MSAAGFLLALSITIGAAIGIVRGEPSLGLLGGLGIGIVLAIVASLRARKS